MSAQGQKVVWLRGHPQTAGQALQEPPREAPARERHNCWACLLTDEQELALITVALGIGFVLGYLVGGAT